MGQGLATRYDEGWAFRRQEPRSLDDIDELAQRQQQLRLAIGLERAADIERHPEQCADGEKFRIYHADARWNAFFFTIAFYVGGVGAAETLAPHLQVRSLMRKYAILPVISSVGVYLVSYQIFHYAAGFDSMLWNEYQYAKMVRQLRNVQIKQ